jgi:hypothetical protein
MGRAVHSGRPVAIQFPFACCAENIWGPMARATVELEATLVIRGQRAREQRRAPIASGHVEDGIEYLFPIEMPPGSRANTLPACGSRQGAALSKRFTSAQQGAFDAAAK